MNQATTELTATVVSTKRRMNVITRTFGDLGPIVENTIFSLMDQFCSDYKGGYWEYYQLTNGGFFMAPSDHEYLRLDNPMNHASVDLSDEAAGIAICAMAYSHMLFEWPHSDLLKNQYTWLMSYAAEHPEAVSIFRFLD